MPIKLTLAEQLVRALNGEVALTHQYSPDAGTETFLLTRIEEFDVPVQSVKTLGLCLQAEPESEEVWVFVSTREVEEYLEFPEYRNMRDISNNYVLE